MSTLTPRQTTELHRIVRKVQEHFGVEIRGVEDFNIHYNEEYRPGRGHDIRIDYIDADYAVTGYMDVYGSTSLSVATVTFIHQDEDCDCSMCAEVPA
jgi:uncharacterized protein YlxP (DUF503 family)